MKVTNHAVVRMYSLGFIWGIIAALFKPIVLCTTQIQFRGVPFFAVLANSVNSYLMKSKQLKKPPKLA